MAELITISRKEFNDKCDVILCGVLNDDRLKDDILMKNNYCRTSSKSY